MENNARNPEWIGGKQVYGGKEEKPPGDWLDEFTDESLGITKPTRRNNDRKITKTEE